MTEIDAYAAGFVEEPGYLDYGRVGPLSATVVAESLGQTEILSRARFGSLDHLFQQDERMREAVSAVTGFRADQVVCEPNTTTGIMQAMFGLTGGVLLSPGDFPTVPFAAVRAAEALRVVTPIWLGTEHGRVTPGEIREQLTPATVAVAVCLVDSRTGFRVDLDGVRQVIGDRLLIVDAIQGFGVTDAAYEMADVVASGGQKWVRSGWGTGFLALSDRAVERLVPVFSGFAGTDVAEPWDEVLPPSHSARAFRVSNGDAIAQARFSAALEEIAVTGIHIIEAAVADNVSQLIDLADEYAVPVVSPRDERERAGILVLEPPPAQLNTLTIALHNHGITATTRDGRVRLSAHAVLSVDTVDMLRGAFTSYATAAIY
ncbi:MULTISPECIES: aminotransferase class V-fold PLP-dependent enzyme [unclassified Cryobacterium]|uniref:aminotransferase class V-fold PLP-dependent enzyme n=1 Tax=unclassified Cryobacterium TaxID=2649013 RepID=UPI00106D970A|nr:MULTISPECIES: aminotransferase class V-fold PLP-dependent enzyme [unclassified Cryobacterium]TFC00023.1 aminotransferase class V-fold PLP-dependent enzyme [Cryobacterium sp. MDB2-A-1]TFC09295.1 aminotransferase class V-fold PLP-dependent enzyme [Cryobacterium sp. MDB2-A-2]TFC17704.1 aminotransferase class V-fold PLP-dependent enzyme [Cryobacterium sp. MDB2-10]